MQIALAFDILIFLYMQYRARGRGTTLVTRMRKHIVWQTTALMVAFITAAFLSKDGFSKNLTSEVIALIVTAFLFVTLLSGTKMFFEIAGGKYDDEIK